MEIKSTLFGQQLISNGNYIRFFYNNYVLQKFDKREINWCSDPEKFDSISEYELFSSNHRDVIFIETILGVCTVDIFIISLFNIFKGSIFRRVWKTW